RRSAASHQPPALLVLKPSAVSQSHSMSARSPWISMTPSTTEPPQPQRALIRLASALSSSAGSASPLMVVTVLPPRPLVSRRTRAIPSPAGSCGRPQMQASCGCRQSGHMRPLSVEYTSPPRAPKPVCRLAMNSTLLQQSTQVDQPGVGPGQIVGHDQRMVGQHTEATTIEDHRTPYGLLGRLQLADDLAQADQGILLVQHLGVILFHRTQQVRQRPGTAPRLVEDVVDLQPGGLLALTSTIGQRCPCHAGGQPL